MYYHGRVVGHIAISPAVISDGTQDWYGIGPLSVTPKLQRQGIGSKLMQTGLERQKAMGDRGLRPGGRSLLLRPFRVQEPSVADPREHTAGCLSRSQPGPVTGCRIPCRNGHVP
jgi:GNAT superfamily N-acetyltransferase